MPDAPLLGPPVAINTHEDGQFSVEFVWATAPDTIWLKTLSDLMIRSGRTSVIATADGVILSFHPQEAEAALDDLAVLFDDAGLQYQTDLEQRDAAIEHVQAALQSRFGAGAELPVKQV